VKKLLPWTPNYPEDRALRASDIIVENEEEWELLAPDLWVNAYNGSTVQNIVYEMVMMGHRATQQELMNNPIPLNPLIKWEWLNDYEFLPVPAEKMDWAIGVDVAAGESKDADYTAMVLCGHYQSNYYIDDFIFGKWTGKKKQTQLEALVKESEQRLDVDYRFFKILIETVMGQRDFYQRVRDESYIIPKAISPSSRGKKKSKGDTYARINHGLAQEMENGKVYLRSAIRNKRQLKIEVDGFPTIKSDHAIDITDQIIYYLKTKSYDIPISGQTTSMFRSPDRLNG
jgi:phage terminase large subunit-like protein